MNLPAEIFKAYDIRGIVGKSLTAEVVRRIGQPSVEGGGACIHKQPSGAERSLERRARRVRHRNQLGDADQ